MLQRLFPKERDFFPNLDDMATRLSQTMSELLACVDTPDKVAESLERIRVFEKETVGLVRATATQLNETFITPFDRAHLFNLAACLQQAVSLARLIAEKLNGYTVAHFPGASIEIVLSCGKACMRVKKMIGQLKKIKETKETIDLCLEIYALSSDAKLAAFEASKELYTQATDLKEFAKMKEINDDLSRMVDKFEAISLLVEEIILENA